MQIGQPRSSKNPQNQIQGSEQIATLTSNLHEQDEIKEHVLSPKKEHRERERENYQVRSETQFEQRACEQNPLGNLFVFLPK